MPRGFVSAALSTAAALAVIAAPAGAATIEVTVANDELNADADCSLREAIQAANTNAAVSGCPKGQANKRDTVRLAPAEAYELTIPSTDENLNQNGDLDVTGTGPTRIKGNTRGMDGPVIVAPANDDRAIDAIDSGKLEIRGLNLEGGDVSGLGAGHDQGGAVRAAQTPLLVDDVNLSHGVAARGGAIYAGGANLTISDSFTGQNEATLFGGGVFASEMDRLRVTRSGFDSNEVVGPDVVRGGGLLTEADETVIVDSLFEFNSAETTGSSSSSHGGGIYSESERLEVRRSLVQSNDTQDVGGSSGSFGGGVKSDAGRVDIVNSTLFGNDTEGSGGALYALKGTVSHVTLDNNQAPDAGDHMAVAGAGPLKIRNSIITGTSPLVDLCFGIPGSFASKGYSVIQYDDSTCGFLDSDAVVADVGFADGIPVNNGGETFTMAIAGTSPAKNLIPKRKCKVAQGEDQRGFKRPKGKKCDAGAFEKGAKP